VRCANAIRTSMAPARAEEILSSLHAMRIASVNRKQTAWTSSRLLLIRRAAPWCIPNIRMQFVLLQRARQHE
jgi:hypothetical protein